MTRWFRAALAVMLVFGAGSTYAQTPSTESPSVRDPFPAGNIEGRVLDQGQVPVAGAMVSVVGRTTAAATTDRMGRYTLRGLPYGPYILSVHSRGYYRSRGRTVQVTTPNVSIPEIRLARANAAPAPLAGAAPAEPARVEPATQLAGFGVDAAPKPVATANAAETPGEEDLDEDGGETAWRLRHLPRSILKDAAADAVWTEGGEMDTGEWLRPSAAAVVPLAVFSGLPFSGQFNLMTTESFDRPGEIFGADARRNVAFVSVNTQAVGGAWAVQGAMTQGELSSWIVAGSYKSIQSGNHAYELGMSYSTQRYDGGNATALGAIRDSARNVGSVFGYDEWTISPRLIVGYGTSFARYDYLAGAGVWSPRVTITVPFGGVRIKALASQRAVVPGAEEFAPSINGAWLPPERTFSSLAPDGRFTAEQTRHAQMSIEHDLGPGVTVALRGFDQRTTDQLAEIFDSGSTRAGASLGHYYVAAAGDIDARGWGVRMTQDVPGYVRGTIEYSVATAYWRAGPEVSVLRAVRTLPPTGREVVHDLQTSIEATIPQTATRVYAMYRVNTAFWSDEPDAYLSANPNARFNVRINQSLPFLQFSNADWEALVDVRNLFRDITIDASVYDEAFAIRAPKRIVGGLLVKF